MSTVRRLRRQLITVMAIGLAVAITGPAIGAGAAWAAIGIGLFGAGCLGNLALSYMKGRYES